MTVLSVAAVVAACGLNPQPLPPGDNAGFSAEDAGTTSASSSSGGGGATSPDGGELLGTDAFAPPTAFVDGGDAGSSDGGDAGADGASDAGADAEPGADASDASDEGG